MNEAAIKETITNGLRDLESRRANYKKYRDYFAGDHELAYATAKFKNAFGDLFHTFADNLMPPVVNGIADNLRIEAFTTEAGSDENSQDAWRVWQNNYMEQRAAELHREVIKMGDAYVIVWNDEQGEPVLYSNKADQVTVGYDDEIPGKINWAIKLWKTYARDWRLNLYLPDRVLKYQKITGETKFYPSMANSETWNYPLDDTGFSLMGEVANPFDKVPVFHFANQADIGEFGLSELAAIIPLNDALNKMILDMLVSSEFGAFRQRWATGIEVFTDEEGNAINPFTGGASNVWTSDNPDAKFGDFNSTDLTQFTAVQESIRAEIARISSIPLHYLLLHTTQLASGRALQTAERRFMGKITGLQTAFGAQWAKVMCFALKLCNCADKDTRLFTRWQDISSISERERLETLRIKREWLPLEQVLKEAGYGSANIRKLVEGWKAEKGQTGDESGAEAVEMGEEITAL